MHKAVIVPQEKPPPRPKALPKVATEYVTITPKPFAIGARSTDEYKDEGTEVFEGVTVTLTRPFMMRATEVTHGEWYFVTGALTASYDKACGLECPVGRVSWKQVLEYLNTLSKREGLESCYTFKNGLAQWPKGYDCTGYRLPTEAEWEYAARGGKDEPIYDELTAIAWYSENSNDTLHPVGKKKKNAYGLYDMLGNAWEWVWDAENYKPYAGDVTDPIGGAELESESQSRVVRGGGYNDYPSSVRATRRYQYPSGEGDRRYGFRPVRTVTTK